jgi:hypothetical protein
MAGLEATLPLEQLRAANPQVAQHLPAEPEAYKAIGRPPRLIFKGTDARLYAVDPEAGRIAVAAEPAERASLGSLLL